MVIFFDALNACSLCFFAFITFDNLRSSFAKLQAMFQIVLALCFILKIFRRSEHYAPKTESKMLVIELAKSFFLVLLIKLSLN